MSKLIQHFAQRAEANTKLHSTQLRKRRLDRMQTFFLSSLRACFRSRHAQRTARLVLSGVRSKSLSCRHARHKTDVRLLTVTRVRFVPLLQRGSCSLRLLLPVLLAAPLINNLTLNKDNKRIYVVQVQFKS